MINLKFLLNTLLLYCIVSTVNAEQFTTYKLKHISADDAITMLKPLTESRISINKSNNSIIIRGSKKTTKNIVNLLAKIDAPAKHLTLEFISAKKKLRFDNPKYTYEASNKNETTAQSINIKERQWVTVDTGISIPIKERSRSADGSETQSTRYKDIKQKYLFNVYEIKNKVYIHVIMDDSNLNNSIAKSIEHKKLDTTIIGKTGEWLEVASSSKIRKKNNDLIFSTKRHKKNTIHLYIRITK